MIEFIRHHKRAISFLCAAFVVQLFVTVATFAWAQSFPLKFDSVAASTNSNQVIIGKAQLRSLVIANAAATVDWLKLYDLAAAPTCGAGTPVFKVQTPANSVTSIEVPDSLQFQNGIGFCLTGAQADNDTSNATSSAIVVNFGFKQ